MHINNQSTYAGTYNEYQQLERDATKWPQWALDLQTSLQRGEPVGLAKEPWLIDTYQYLKNKQDAQPVSTSDGFMTATYFIGHQKRKGC